MASEKLIVEFSVNLNQKKWSTEWKTIAWFFLICFEKFSDRVDREERIFSFFHQLLHQRNF